MPYNTTMKKTMMPRMMRAGRMIPRAVPLSRAQQRFYNPGVAVFERSRPGYRAPAPFSATNYYNAGVMVAYGKTNEAAAELGDLFNDVMGAIVPGWDQRPDWMKRIAVKPDPTKLLQAAQRVAPQAGAQVVSAANRYGFNIYANTPAGQVMVSPEMAQGMYQGMPFLARAQSAFESVPGWVWAVGAGGVVLLFVAMKRK